MKTYFCFNRNRLLSHRRFAIAVTSISAAAAVVLFATLLASSVYADQPELTIVYQFAGDPVLGVPDPNHATFTLA